jgi:hypothetical protein
VSLFHFRPRLQTLEFNNLPKWLKQNYFINAVYEPSSTNVADTNVQHIIAHLPEGFELISYLSDHNVSIKGKQEEISIIYSVSSISRPMYIDHRIPSIANIPISPRYENELKKDLGNLLFIDTLLSFDADLSRWRSVFKRRVLDILKLVF